MFMLCSCDRTLFVPNLKSLIIMTTFLSILKILPITSSSESSFPISVYTMFMCDTSKDNCKVRNAMLIMQWRLTTVDPKLEKCRILTEFCGKDLIFFSKK